MRYRIRFAITYTENPDHPPPPGTKRPSDRKKAILVRDNRTYAFRFNLQSCYYVPKITATLYSREWGNKYKEVPLGDSITTTTLIPLCKTTQVQPTAASQPTAAATNPPAVSFGGLAVTVPTPVQGTPTPTSIVPLAMLTRNPVPQSNTIQYFPPPAPRTQASQEKGDTTSFGSAPPFSFVEWIKAIIAAIFNFFIRLLSPIVTVFQTLFNGANSRTI